MDNQYNPYQPTGNITTAIPSQPDSAKKHSGLGITSFILGIISFIGFILSFGIAGFIYASMNYDEAAFVLVGVAIIVCFFLCIVAMILGIIGINQPERKKLFGILGLSISGVIFLLACILMAIGAMNQALTANSDGLFDVFYRAQHPLSTDFQIL